jgi:tetratricopeptide (TPR) repeat protein
MALFDQSARIRQLQERIEADGFDQLAHYQLGEEYVRLERWHEAFAKFRRVIELNPESLEAYLAFGDAATKAGIYKEADAAWRTGETVATRLSRPEYSKIFGERRSQFTPEMFLN